MDRDGRWGQELACGLAVTVRVDGGSDIIRRQDALLRQPRHDGLAPKWSPNSTPPIHRTRPAPQTTSPCSTSCTSPTRRTPLRVLLRPPASRSPVDVTVIGFVCGPDWQSRGQGFESLSSTLACDTVSVMFAQFSANYRDQ